MNLMNGADGVLFRPFWAQIWYWPSPQGNALGAMTKSCFRPEGAEPSSVPDQAQRSLSGHKNGS